MFDEKTMQMAKSLGQDLVRDKKEKEKQEVRESFNAMKDAVIELWETIKSTVSEAFEAIYGQHNEHLINKNKPSKNWHVPMKIEAPPMPDIKMPCLAYARSNI